MLLILHTYRQVAYQKGTFSTNDVDSTNITAYLTDACCESTKHTGTIIDLAAHGEGIGDAHGHRDLA